MAVKCQWGKFSTFYDVGADGNGIGKFEMGERSPQNDKNIKETLVFKSSNHNILIKSKSRSLGVWGSFLGLKIEHLGRSITGKPPLLVCIILTVLFVLIVLLITWMITSFYFNDRGPGCLDKVTCTNKTRDDIYHQPTLQTNPNLPQYASIWKHVRITTSPILDMYQFACFALTFSKHALPTFLFNKTTPYRASTGVEFISCKKRLGWREML